VEQVVETLLDLQSRVDRESLVGLSANPAWVALAKKYQALIDLNYRTLALGEMPELKRAKLQGQVTVWEDVLNYVDQNLRELTRREQEKVVPVVNRIIPDRI
jgi:hypothetical protein